MVRRFALVTVLLAATLSIVWSAIAAPQVLPRLRLAPGFGLHDPAGETVSSDSLRGSTLVVTFGPAQCDERCRAWGRTVATALPRDLSPEQFQLVWIVTAPATPADLAALEGQLPAAPLPWRVLGTDDARQLELVLAGFRVPRVVSAAGSLPDPILIIVDPAGIVRAEYRVSPQSQVIAQDLAALKREIRESRGLRRYLYEAAHLFTCNVGGL